MILGNSKKGIKDFALKGIAALSASALLLATGCSLTGSDFAAVDKDIKTDYHARIVYTDNTLDEEGNTKVYASIYNPNEDETKLIPIETEKEWKIIETILDELQNEVNKNGE